jgi:predicted acetyltransferase
MDIEVTLAGLPEKTALLNLMELYLYEFSDMEGLDLDDSGRYGYRYLDLYWTEAGRHPFLIRVDGKLAGFALVRKGSSLLGESPHPGEGCTHMAEFFILRKYRRQGAGTRAARELFDRFPGRWEVAEIPENGFATSFWRRVIGEYSGGDYEEVWLDNERWKGPVQIFTSRE